MTIRRRVAPSPGGSADAGCAIDINTAAKGFGTIWQAVMTDFHERHRLAGVRVWHIPGAALEALR